MGTKRLTIGLFIDWIENFYQSTLLSGINASAEKLDVNIFIYVGGAPKSVLFSETQKTIIYNFVDKKKIDGLLIVSGSVGRFSTVKELEKFCHKYTDIPVVTIAQKIADHPVVRIDSKQGMKNLIYHLIDDHNFKNLAFISGPENNQDSKERYSAFREVLKEKKIPYNDNSVVAGTFVLESGCAAVCTLLDKNSYRADAIIAANDNMAVGAIRELQSRGLRVPEDIAVVGFDNQEIYEYLSPSLTTVKQPVFALGQESIETLVESIKGNLTDKHIILPTPLIIRESCGCSIEPAVVTENRNIRPISEKKKINLIVFNQIKDLLLHTGYIEVEFITHSDIAEIINEFYKEIENTDKDVFINKFKKLINRLFFRGLKEPLLQNIVTIIKENLIKTIDSYKTKYNIQQLIDRVRCHISELAEKKRGKYEVLTHAEVLNFRIHIDNMIEEVDIKKVLDNLEKILKDININSFYLSRYINLKTETPDNVDFEILFAFRDNERMQIPEAARIYPAFFLLPDNFLSKEKRFFIIIEPLFSDKRHIGCAFMDIPFHKNILSNMILRTLMYNLLKNALYIQQLHDQSEKLHIKTEELTIINDLLQQLLIRQEENEEKVNKLNEELEERVKKRTGELHIANQNLTETLDELKQMQNDLVESKKMAALGRLVAGIAHEINTPIGIGVTAASHLAKETGNLYSHFIKENMKKSDLKTYINTAQEAATMVLSNLQRAYELIRSFKDIAVDQSNETVRKFNIKDYIQDVLLSLRPRLKKVKHTIKIECADNLLIYSYPGAFSQIITNLIMNSLIHAFDPDDKGIITIYVKEESHVLSVVYSDNGKGIMKKNLKKIFEPFFTTNRRDGGTGLGLHLVYNIIKQQLRGNITCNSNPGNGTMFSITIPLENNYQENLNKKK